MKKTVLKLVALLLLVLFVALALAACGGTVKFKLNFIVDGKVYDTVDTAGQEAVALPENPTKAGDEFDGWYWDEGTWERPFTANSLLDAPLSSDMSVYAKWKSDDVQKVDPSAASIVSAPAFEINGNALSLTLPNATESYSFLGQITVSAGAIWQVSTDMQGLNAIPTKTVSLNLGDNTFYLLVTSANGEGVSLYTVTVRRRPIYTVSFNANGGDSVAAIRAEEDSTINPPKTTRTGYTFVGWDYDFTQPIKGNLTTAAKWTSNTDTSYTVEYYLQNAGATGYDLEERVPLMGTTASTVTAEQKTYPHFTYKASGSKSSGTIAPDGSLVLKLYYTRDTYTVTFVGDGGTLESGNATQTVRYGNSATLPTFARKGYTFTGWDKESNAVAEDLTVNAQWSIDTYTVSYDVNGGEAIANPAIYRITDDAPLAEPTWEYGRFLGWYTASDEKVSNLQGYAGDLSLTAKWECYFTQNGNTITGITDFCRQNVTEIVIPASLNGKAITGIAANAFANCTRLTSIVIPDSVTSIGENAFYGCNNLQYNEYDNACYLGNESNPYVTLIKAKDTSITSCSIHPRTKVICDYAFYNCTGLKTLVIGNGVTSLSSGLLQGCSSLESITIPFVGGSIKTANDTYQYPFGYIFGTSSYTGGVATTQYYYGSSTSSTTNTTYYIPSSLKSVTVTGGEILYGAFYNCTGLISVTIPNGVTSIGNSAFSGCNKLQYNEYDNAYYLGNESNPYVALIKAKNTSITSCAIHPKTKCIYNSAFYNCAGLTSVTIGDSVTSIGYEAFCVCTGLTSITIPDSVTSIEDSAFRYCTGLTSITIPDSVTSIGRNAFYNCDGLTSITIPDSVTSIGEEAFCSCSGLTSVTIGNGVTSIGRGAFSECSRLVSMTTPFAGESRFGYIFGTDGIPSSLKSVTVTGGYIPNKAFYCCSGLTSVTIGNGVTSIGDFAFDGCSGLTGSLTIPNSVTSIGERAFEGCTGLTAVVWNATNCTSAGSNGHPIFIGCSKLTTVTFGDNVETIPAYAFYTCSGLTSVTIGNNVTSIGDYAFSNCSGLTSVTIPRSVTSIGNYAFYKCSGLTSVVWNATDCTSGTNDDSVFSGCTNLMTVTFGDNVKTIPAYAFKSRTGLTSVTIGNGVTSIGRVAFWNCSGLARINYRGTKAQWNAISKGSSWNSKTGYYIVYCTDGTISERGSDY